MTLYGAFVSDEGFTVKGLSEPARTAGINGPMPFWP